MVNGENAVGVSFSHDDNFANGENQASMLYGRFKAGMEQDVYTSVGLDTVTTISKEMQHRLYNEALRYLSANTRQLELYNKILDFSESMQAVLSKKCEVNKQ